MIRFMNVHLLAGSALRAVRLTPRK